MQFKHLVVAVALAFSAPLFAAGEAPAKTVLKPSAKRMLPASTADDVVGRTVYQVLLGEFALQRNDLELAASAWGDLAVRTRDPQAMARAVEVLTVARKYDAALELSELWLQQEPDSQKAAQARSALMVQADRLDDLAPQIAALLAQNQAALPANLMQLNRLLARHVDKVAVQKLIDRLAQPYATLPEAHFAMSQAASTAGDNARALHEIEQTLVLRPEWEAAALIRAQLVARQSPAQAIELLADFVRHYPDAQNARLTLARLLITEKRYKESRVHFDALIQTAPDNPDVIYPLAMLALQEGDALRGRAQLEHLLQTEFPDKNAVHFYLGQIDEELKQLDSAMTQYTQVVAGDQYIPARTRLALLQQQQGQTEAARETLRGTRGRNAAERTQLLLGESQLLRELGRHDEAYAVLEKALVKDPDNTELLYEAALLAERRGKPEILEKHLRRVIELKPDHAHALNALGYSLADRNVRLAEAEKLIARALKAAPEDAFIIDSQGWLFFRQGRQAEALSTLQRAYALKADGEIAAHIGEVLWKMGRKDEARQVLDDAFRAHPENEALLAIRKKLLP